MKLGKTELQLNDRLTRVHVAMAVHVQYTENTGSLVLTKIISHRCVQYRDTCIISVNTRLPIFSVPDVNDIGTVYMLVVAIIYGCTTECRI